MSREELGSPPEREGREAGENPKGHEDMEVKGEAELKAEAELKGEAELEGKAEVRRESTLLTWVADARTAAADGFTFFDWLSAVDRMYDEAAPGFDIVCHLLDVSRVGSLRSLQLVVRVHPDDELPSLTGVFPGAAWHEREVHEMFGIEVSGFDDGTPHGIRPLLLPDGFEGTPLRKSFQLAARASKVWPGGKEPGEGHESTRSPARRRVQAPGVPPPEWGPR